MVKTQKHKLTKEVQKLLKDIEGSLPVVFYTVPETQVWKGADLKLTGVKPPEGKEFEDDQEYFINQPVEIASNHYRRLKKAYLKDGAQGVKAYVAKVNALVQKQIELNK